MGMTKEQVIEAFAVIGEDGSITDFNFDDFDQLVKDLVTARKNMRAEAKETKKAKQAEENEGKIKVGKVNVDEEPELAMKFGIMSIPTIIVFKDGEVANKTMGFQPKENLMALL